MGGTGLDMVRVLTTLISEIVVDGRTYPRNGKVEAAIERYAAAMRKGDIFPPIRVGRITNQEPKITYLVDGYHRLCASLRVGKTTIKAEVRHYGSREEIYIDAIKLNATHGEPFRQYERMRIATNLKQSGHSTEEISEILRILPEEVERITINIVEVKRCEVCRKIETAEPSLIGASAPNPQELFSQPDPFGPSSNKPHLLPVVLLQQNGGGYEDRVVERLASTLHEEWLQSTTHIMQGAQIAEGTLEYYRKLLVPYEELPEERQSTYKQRARAILSLIETNCLKIEAVLRGK